MGATPSHQANTQALNHELWEAEGVLQVLPCLEGAGVSMHEEDMPTMEGGAICTSCIQEKCHKSSLGSIALESTPAMQGPWSRTTSLKDWYPDEHPFIKNHCDTDDPNKTPYTLNTQGFPLYKRSFMLVCLWHNSPIGFKCNEGANYIDYPICQGRREVMQQAQYVQAIMTPSPIIVGLCDNMDKVYSKPLYATPIYQYDGKPTYTTADLDVLKMDVEG